MKILVLIFLLALGFNFSAFASDKIDSRTAFHWGITISECEWGVGAAGKYECLGPKNYENTEVNTLIDSGYKSKKIRGVSCRFDFSKGQSQKIEGSPLSEIYNEALDVECEVNGMGIETDSVSCYKLDGAGYDLWHVGFRKDGRRLSIYVSCGNKQ